MAAELQSEYLLCQTDLLYQGKLYDCKAPLDAHQLLIYLFLLQYLTCNSAEPDRGTRKEEEQRRRNRTKTERKTRQPAATPAKTKQTKKSTASVGNPALAPPGAPESRQTEKNKQKQAQVAAIA